MRHALREWATLRRSLERARGVLLLADFDGTLTPIVGRPEHARLPAPTKRLLRRLSRLPGVRVGIVSGRALSTLRRLVGLPGLAYAGNHGVEVRGPGLQFVHPAARRSIPLMRRIARELRRTLRGIPGAIVEDKRLSLSVHWRTVPPSRRQGLHREVRTVLAPWQRRGAIRVVRGKRVYEIRPPVEWHKGSAVDWLRAHWRFASGTVLYVGDDRTDEDAFRTVNRRRGLSIIVEEHPQRTAARWWLRDAREVRGLLSRLATAREAHCLHVRDSSD